MKKITFLNSELNENDQSSTIPHEILNDLNEFYSNIFIKYWRIWVNMCCIFISVQIIRSIIFVTSPLFSTKMNKNDFNSIPNEEIELKPITKKRRKVFLKNFPSITSLDE